MSTCSANIDGWCETHSTGEGPSWCVDALKVALQRARFHERENYSRFKAAEAVIEALGIEEWHPDDGDTRCQRCGRQNPVWFADNTIWNAVMPDDGILCPTCFALAAHDLLDGPTWRLTTERRGLTTPAPSERTLSLRDLVAELAVGSPVEAFDLPTGVVRVECHEDRVTLVVEPTPAPTPAHPNQAVDCYTTPPTAAAEAAGGADHG